MPPIRQRPSAAAAVTKAAIAQATKMLDELPARPKESWSLREAVNMLQDSITTALSRGYSYEEVTVLLAGKGVDITASSLKRYLATAKKTDGSTKVTKTRKPRMTKAAKAAAAAAAPAEEAAPKRRGRKPGAAKAAAAQPTRTAAARKSTAASDTTKVAKTRAPKAVKTPGTRGRKKKIAE
jgi:hypothetical protein